MTRFIPAILAIALAGTAFAPPAAAQARGGTPCADRAQAVEHLRTHFGERRLGHGLAESGAVIEIFAGPSGSFTVFATTPRGLSCLIAAGHAWEPLPQQEIFAAQ